MTLYEKMFNAIKSEMTGVDNTHDLMEAASACEKIAYDLLASKWVSVEDYLPTERIEPVLLFNGDAPEYNQYVFKGTWFGQTQTFKRDANDYPLMGTITHWMPLPPKPIELDAMKSKVFKEVLESCPPEAEEKAREYAKEILDKGAMKEPRELTETKILSPSEYIKKSVLENLNGSVHDMVSTEGVATRAVSYALIDSKTHYQSLLAFKEEEIARLKKAIVEEVEDAVYAGNMMTRMLGSEDPTCGESEEYIKQLKERYK